MCLTPSLSGLKFGDLRFDLGEIRFQLFQLGGVIQLFLGCRHKLPTLIPLLVREVEVFFGLFIHGCHRPDCLRGTQPRFIAPTQRYVARGVPSA